MAGRFFVCGWAAMSSFQLRIEKSRPDVFFKKQIRSWALDLKTAATVAGAFPQKSIHAAGFCRATWDQSI